MVTVARERARRLSLDEWAMLDEDAPYELVDGALEADEMAGWAHEVVVVWLIGLLGAWARQHDARVGGSDLRLGVSASRGRKADVVVYLSGSPRPPGSGLVRTPPSIVVEVVSPNPSDARRDRLDKLDDYARFGVAWYWLVDPQLRSLEILHLGDDGHYKHVLGASQGAVAVPACDGLIIDLDAMWRDLDAALVESGS